MTMTLQNSKQAAVAELESQWTLIKNMYCKSCTPDEAALFFEVCKRTGLNPIQRHIYPIKYGSQLNIITGIDGFRLIAERTGKYSPGKSSEFQYDQSGNIISATSFIKKMTEDGTWHEISATAYMEEYSTGKGNWTKMPRVMLSKCAESLALRKAFPADLSGVYTKEEMDQAEEEMDQSEENPPTITVESSVPTKGGEDITEAEVARLDSFLSQVGAKDINEITTFLKISSIYEVKKSDLERVINILKKKIEGKQKKGNKNESSAVA